MSASIPPVQQTDTAKPRRRGVLNPTLVQQCWGFMIGSALFAIGTAPGFPALAGTAATNWLCFIGAGFFTAAGLIQLARSAPAIAQATARAGRVVRAEWLAAFTQTLGTIAFNVSTAAALVAHNLSAEKHYVWSPDAGGSVAFLVSGALLLIAYRQSGGRFWSLGDTDWWSAQINMMGCIAFAFSAFGAFLLQNGQDLDGMLANGGTFVGAICFFAASLVVLPGARARG